MYLFDKQGSKINVYNMVANSQAIKEYKEQELYKMDPYNKIVYCAKTNAEPILELKDVIYDSELNYNIAGEFHQFYYDCYKPEVIRYFIEGSFNNNRVVKVLNGKEEIVGYLLITQGYNTKLSQGENSMFNILSIPRSLYLLQMLQQCHFDTLNDADINEQLKLFQLIKEPVDELSINDFSYLNEGQRNMMSSSEMILERKLKIDSQNRKKK